uniref:Integrase core domain containing protein n=1 Tax=Solanum tuberosum TaxID=4113 RepID=M1DH00_SOLTU
MWTTVRRSIYGPFCMSVVSNRDQLFGISELRRGSMDRLFWVLTTPPQEEVPVPRNNNPDPVEGEPSRWCVEGQWKIYWDAKMLNEKERMARLNTEERKVLTGNLHTMPDIHRLFKLHKCKWMARDPKTYSEEIVREFYASYATTLRGSIDKRSKPTAQDPLISTMALKKAVFNYKLDIVRSGAFTRNAEQREALLLWLARQIAADGERAEWVATPRLGIRKATLNLVAKFFWLLVRNRVSPTKTNNLLCRDAGVPIWHCDKLVHAIGTLDIRLIRDEANVEAPRRGPWVDVPDNADLVDAVEQMQGDDPTPPAHNDDTPFSSLQYVVHVFMCCLESKISGGDPSVFINVFRVKTFGYDFSGATLRVPEEDPNLGQANCQGSLKLFLEGACQRRGLAPPRDKSLVRVADM